MYTQSGVQRGALCCVTFKFDIHVFHTQLLEYCLVSVRALHIPLLPFSSPHVFFLFFLPRLKLKPHNPLSRDRTVPLHLSDLKLPVPVY